MHVKHLTFQDFNREKSVFLIYTSTIVYCYADNIGLLSPTLSGLKEMLKLCEDYALKHYIIFNAYKSQLLYFSSNTARVPKDFMLKMKTGQSHNWY